VEPASISSVGRCHPCGALAFKGASLDRVLEASAAASDRSPEDIASDEFYWREIQEAFTLDRELPFKLSDLECD